MSTLPIADHALLSDRHSAALVTRDGSAFWLCFPRFDSESVFAAPLDDEAGHLVVPVLSEVPGGIVATRGSSRLTMSMPERMPDTDIHLGGIQAGDIRAGDIQAGFIQTQGEISLRFTLEAGQPRYFALQGSRLGQRRPSVYTQGRIAAALDTTVASWQ